MQTPTPGSTLSGNVATFTWCAGLGATAYWMDVGSTLGGNNYYQSGNLGNVLTTTVYSLPADGSQIYVTLWSLVGGSGTRTNTITLPVRKDLKRDSMPPSSGRFDRGTDSSVPFFAGTSPCEREPAVTQPIRSGAVWDHLRDGDFRLVNSRLFGNSEALIRPPAARRNFTDTPPMQNIFVLVLRTTRHVPEQTGSCKCCFRGEKTDKWARVCGRRILALSLESLCSASG